MPKMTEAEVEHYIDVWRAMAPWTRESLGSQCLHEFLGWTWQQYAEWVQTGRIPDES